VRRRAALALLGASALAACWRVPAARAAMPAAQPLAAMADGETFAFGETDGRVRLFRFAGDAAPPPVAAHDGPVRAVAALPDGWFVTGGADGRIRLWRTGRADAAHDLFEGAGPVTALAASEAIGGIAAGFADGRVRVWIGSGVIDRQPLVFRGHDRDVTGVAFSADQKSVASAGLDATIRRTRLVEASVETVETEGPVTAMAAAFDGEIAAAVGFGQIVFLAPDGRERMTLRAFAESSAKVAVSADGDWVAVLGAGGRAFVFERHGGRPYWSDDPGQGDSVALAIQPDSQHLVTVTREGRAIRRAIRTGEPL
jgi:cytochrome c